MFITEEIRLNQKEIEEALKKTDVFTKWEIEDRGIRNLKGLGQKRLWEVKWFIPPKFLVMPSAFDAIYNFLMKYPVQPGLAFYVYGNLKEAQEDIKASKLRVRFKEIGHIFPSDECNNGSGNTRKDTPT